MESYLETSKFCCALHTVCTVFIMYPTLQSSVGCVASGVDTDAVSRDSVEPLKDTFSNAKLPEGIT